MNKREFESKNKQYGNIQASLHKLTENQQELNARTFTVSEHIRNLGNNGGLADRTHTEMIRKLGILASIFPEKDKPDGDDPFGKEAKWSPEQIIDIEEGLMAFYNPDKIMQEYIMGRKPVSDTAVDVLKKAHPGFVNKMREILLNGMYSGQMKFSYTDKIKLSELFDMPLKSIMTGEAQLTVDGMWRDEVARRRNLMQRGASLPTMVDVQDNAAARAASIRG